MRFKINGLDWWLPILRPDFNSDLRLHKAQLSELLKIYGRGMCSQGKSFQNRDFFPVDSVLSV